MPTTPKHNLIEETQGADRKVLCFVWVDGKCVAKGSLAACRKAYPDFTVKRAAQFRPNH